MKNKTEKMLVAMFVISLFALTFTGCGSYSEKGRSVEETVEVFFETVVTYRDDYAYRLISKSDLPRSAFLESVGFQEWEEKRAPDSDRFAWRLTSGDKPEYKLLHIECLDDDAATKELNERIGLNAENIARAYIDSNIFGLDSYLTCVLVDGDWYLLGGVKTE